MNRNIFDKIYKKHFKKSDRYRKRKGYFNLIHLTLYTIILLPILLLYLKPFQLILLYLFMFIPVILQLLSNKYRYKIIKELKNSMPDFTFLNFILFILILFPILYIIYNIIF